MSIITLILAGIVALEHLYIMYLETFATHSDTTSRVFNMRKEELQRDSVTNLFKNKGIYNGLIAVFLLYGIFTNSQLLVTVFVLNVFFAAVYGAVTANKKIIFTQGEPAILTLFSLIISLFWEFNYKRKKLLYLPRYFVAFFVLLVLFYCGINRRRKSVISWGDSFLPFFIHAWQAPKIAWAR